jgi:uncharacterized protein YjbI with pentapeptide repeats
MKYEIKHRVTGAVLFSTEAESLRAAVEAAVKAGANLEDANLEGADLENANLARANLARANLARANLARADLENASLAGADLARADLAHAYLAGADLEGGKLPDLGVDARALRLRVAEHIEAHPELHDQREWGDGTAYEACNTPCCVAGWACHLGGGNRGLSIPTAATLLLHVDGLPMPDFSATATREDILKALRTTDTVATEEEPA